MISRDQCYIWKFFRNISVIVITNRCYISGEGGTTGASRSSVSGTLSYIVRTEGVAALYSGIVPGLQRQMAFSAIRIGAYEHVREYYKELTGVTGGLGLMAVRIGAGVTTGM